MTVRVLVYDVADATYRLPVGEVDGPSLDARILAVLAAERADLGECEALRAEDDATIRQLMLERDEARAESEGLRAALRTCADLLKRTQDAHEWSDHFARQIAIAIAEAHAALTPPSPTPAGD